MNWLTPLTLSGKYARLEPLSHERHDELVEAVKDGELWKLWYTFIPGPDRMREDIDQRLRQQEQGSMLPFTVIDTGTDRAVGMTTFMNADAANKRVEIGSTWYRTQVQRTPLNTECKLMLLQHAFESLGCIAVEFRTHFFNTASRRAIERVGAKLDGILRNHRFSADGTLRDTCVYSVIATEWPTVKAHLTYQVGKARAAH
jgi:RimJ/RimL family protein N-acetyltransferase